MEETNTLRRVVNWIVDIIVVISLAWFVVYGFGTQVKMAGQSMAPLLKSEDVILVNRLVYDFSRPKRFDVVVFQRDDKKSNVKRVIGLPGEVIQIKGGSIFINDQILETEDYKMGYVSLGGLAENPIQLDEDEYFLLGDNREGSEDSRFANIGNVNREQILGKVWIRISPLIDLGLID